ncbi:hypothetical protein EVAR_4538_1 [Eumeta japonica]|uniref:Uncharacterized protein n=1 Tax=Eumeta variegata TaxID=151549 RepID=A0A4C1SWS1_EUMVA|nr:hypothetical protein EVAR_4538_1 [Eumeta japonica]
MSVSVETDVANPLCEGQRNAEGTIARNSLSKNSLERIQNDVDESKDEKTEPETPKPYPMAFTVDFGDTKQIDKQKLEQLARQSQARHQRVQSMSASLTKSSPIAQKPPMSAKLPRKAQGYNSEGYFSSDQEDSVLSGSVKLRQSPLTQNCDLKTHMTSPVTVRHVKSPINDSFQTKVKTSKSPIVDSIMSRSDTLPSRQGLNLPLKHTNNSYVREVHRTPSYGNLSNHPRYRMADIIDQSPEGIMLTDISSPELEVLTPDNGLSTPEIVKPVKDKTRRAVSETPDEFFKKCIPKIEPLYIDDDVDRQSNNSSTGTYTIEGDNYTEEQKARMSIDRTFGADLINNAVDDALKKRSVTNEKDPELIFDYPTAQKVITEEPRGSLTYRCLPQQIREFDVPKVSKDKNVLEISCCYESPTETDLAVQTSKQIKSTRSYLEKIKNRVRTITEKTFAKSPPKHTEDQDVGSFTSVTTSGVLSSKNPSKPENPNRRRCSLTKSEIDQTDYIHRLSRESSVPVSLPSNKSPLEDAKFESTALRNAQAKTLKDDSGVSSDITPEQVVGKLSYLSLNRCKGDKTWIQDWAESVKKYNSNSASPRDELNTFPLSDSERPPPSPRHLSTPSKNLCSARAVHPSGGTPTKIPSPVGTLHSRAKQVSHFGLYTL